MNRSESWVILVADIAYEVVLGDRATKLHKHEEAGHGYGDNGTATIETALPRLGSDRNPWNATAPCPFAALGLIPIYRKHCSPQT